MGGQGWRDRSKTTGDQIGDMPGIVVLNSSTHLGASKTLTCLVTEHCLCRGIKRTRQIGNPECIGYYSVVSGTDRHSVVITS